MPKPLELSCLGDVRLPFADSKFSWCLLLLFFLPFFLGSACAPEFPLASIASFLPVYLPLDRI